MKDGHERQAKSLDEIVGELERAIAHTKIAAAHFREGEVPRGCAHTLAVQGHVQISTEILSQIAKLHRVSATI